MYEKRTVFMGFAFIAFIGAISMNLTPKDALGCGGSDFSSSTEECSVAQFDITMETGDLDSIVRNLCFRTLKSEAGCTVFHYNIVPVTERVALGSEPSDEFVDITYGRGCSENRVEGSLFETIGEEQVTMALSGTPTRAPIPMVQSAKPLAKGACMSDKWETGEFDLFVTLPSE